MLIKTSKKSETVRVQKGIQPNQLTSQQRAKINADFRSKLDAKARANAGLQRTQQMSREERSRVAQDTMVKEHMEFYRGAGVDVTETQVRSEVQKIAESAEQKRDVD